MTKRKVTSRCWTALAALAFAGAGSPAFAEEASPGVVEEKPTDEESFGLSGGAEIVSDYRYRGVSLSDGKPAVQIGAEYAHSSGLFVGAWGSTIAEEEGAEQELDLYAGYSGSLGGLGYTLTATQYVYPGGDGLNYFEFTSEIEAGFGRGAMRLEVSYVPDQKNTEGDNLYTAAELSYGLESPAITGFARVGRENGFYDNKWDWEIGVRHERGPVSLRASYVATANDEDSDPTLLAAVAYSF